MSAGFTPGPWRSDQESVWCTLANCAVVEIARTNLFEELHAPSAYANARLIAAVPELYEALSDLMENPQFATAIGGNPNMVEALMVRANAALAKARGEAA